MPDVQKTQALYDVTRKWFAVIPPIICPLNFIFDAPFGRFAPSEDSIFLVDDRCPSATDGSKVAQTAEPTHSAILRAQAACNCVTRKVGRGRKPKCVWRRQRQALVGRPEVWWGGKGGVVADVGDALT
ncbi:hypothetical protein BD413DRAFT_708986, partial [Trametes elegans]